MINIRIKNTSNHPLPAYETSQSAGMDLRAVLETSIAISPQKRVLIPTGIHIELPEGFEAQVRPRSGLALRHGITVLNSPGTVDADYRGEIKVVLINHGEEPFVVNDGDRIAQLVVARHEHVTWELTEGELVSTERGERGYGSTGVKS